MTKTVSIFDCCGEFAENKDSAKSMRETVLRPHIEAPDGRIILDFEGIDSSTQSFIHALLSDLLQVHGASILDRIEFQSCNKSIKSLIATVVDYSLD